jgi:hypothetical protein
MTQPAKDWSVSWNSDLLSPVRWKNDSLTRTTEGSEYRSAERGDGAWMH